MLHFRYLQNGSVRGKNSTSDSASAPLPSISSTSVGATAPLPDITNYEMTVARHAEKQVAFRRGDRGKAVKITGNPYKDQLNNEWRPVSSSTTKRGCIEKGRPQQRGSVKEINYPPLEARP